jgi:hypothetical protein
MATIDLVKVRAKIEMGSLKIETPYIQSFSVKKSRGAISTFDASLKVEAGKVSGAITGSKVIIHAGVKNNLNKIFTGMVRQAKISPCFDDPQFVLLSVSGSDDLILLNGKKYSRRCRATKSKYVTITGVVRAGLKTTGLNYEKDPFVEITSGTLEKDSVVVATSSITQPGASNMKVSSAPPPKGETGAVLTATLREAGD